MVRFFVLYCCILIFIYVETNNDKFEVYDDNKLNHVIAAPDYGQAGDTDLAWSCENSKEYKQICFCDSSSSKLLIKVIDFLKSEDSD